MPKIVVKGYQVGRHYPVAINKKFLKINPLRKYEIDMSEEEMRSWKKSLNKKVKKEKLSDVFVRVMLIFPDNDEYYIDDLGVVEHNGESYIMMPNVFLALYLFLDNIDVSKAIR